MDAFFGGRDGVLWYFSSLVQALDGGPCPDLHAELRATVAALLQQVEPQSR
jgi:hypothetical protein